jgi:hypothetical protein
MIDKLLSPLIAERLALNQLEFSVKNVYMSYQLQNVVEKALRNEGESNKRRGR